MTMALLIGCLLAASIPVQFPIPAEIVYIDYPGFKVPVKKTFKELTVTEVRFDGGVAQSQYKHSYKFDGKGLIAEKMVFMDGNHTSTQKNKYDDRNNCIEKLMQFANNSPDERFTYTYAYDGKGNVIERIYRDVSRKTIEKNYYGYDAHNNLITYEEQDYKGDYAKGGFVYDDRNNKIENYGCNPDGSKYTARSYVYDGKNHLIEEYTHDPKGKKFKESEYRYDAKGRLTEYIWHGELSKKNLYKYDAKGRLAQIIEMDISSGFVYWRAFFDYNKAGDVSTITIRVKYSDAGAKVDEVTNRITIDYK